MYEKRLIVSRMCNIPFTASVAVIAADEFRFVARRLL